MSPIVFQNRQSRPSSLPRQNRPIRITAFLGSVCLFFHLFLQGTAAAFVPAQESVLKPESSTLVGSNAGSIVAKNLVTGKPIQFQINPKDRGTVIVFLSVNCPCSRSHEPALEKLYQKFKNSGFAFLGVHSNFNEPEDEALKHFQGSGLSFPVIQDVGSKLADQLEAFKTPHAYVLNSERQIVFQGGVDNSKIHLSATQHYLESALVALQKGQEITENNVRVLGCEIKRP